jgi:predicted membrane protein
MGSLTFPAMIELFNNEVLYTATSTPAAATLPAADAAGGYEFSTVMIEIAGAAAGLIALILCLHFCFCRRRSHHQHQFPASARHLT